MSMSLVRMMWPKRGRPSSWRDARARADPLWPTTDYLADLAFNTLLYRGYSKTNIQYLNPVTNRDVDGNGQTDDIDLETTWANAALTFMNWATDTDRLFVYLVDHGGEDSSGVGYFRLNESESSDGDRIWVRGWIDLQNTYTTKVTVLIDCCYAGSFLDELVVHWRGSTHCHCGVWNQ